MSAVLYIVAGVPLLLCWVSVFLVIAVVLAAVIIGNVTQYLLFYHMLHVHCLHNVTVVRLPPPRRGAGHCGRGGVCGPRPQAARRVARHRQRGRDRQAAHYI